MLTPNDPIKIFKHLYIQIHESSTEEPTAMSLATANNEGVPSVRIVLLKDFDESGFVFYTNMASRKAKELRENPMAALCFYWEPIYYQVRIEGTVNIVADTEADAYFASRPRASQIGAWASRQSNVLKTRDELAKRIAKYDAKFKGIEAPRPEFWSGFRLLPNTIEFWLRHPDRLHERTLYTRVGELWESNLLYP